MFVDRTKRTAWDLLRQHGLRPFAPFLTPELFAAAARKAGLSLGAGVLNLPTLVWLGISAALHPTRSFADVLGLTLKLLEDSEHWHASALAHARRNARRRTTPRSKHDPRGSDPTTLSEEAFLKARHKMPWSFWVAVIVLLGERFEARHPKAARWKHFRLLALDGTTLNLERWNRLAKHFGTARNGKQGRRPQARLVLLQLPLVRLPWRCELGPLAEGERSMAARLLKDLRPDDLLLMDRGFWSYGIFCQIQQQRAFFAIRLMRGVKLRTRRRLGPKDRLVRWTPADRKWVRQGLPATLELRRIDYQLKGFRPSAVVTNLTDPRVITREEWVRLADSAAAEKRLEQGLYHRRWEIETTFSELKVEQKLEGSLRSRTPEGIVYEVAGHLVLYLLLRWLLVEAAQRVGADPLELSFAQAREELLDLRPALETASAGRAARVLRPRLLERMAAERVAFRPGRHYPRPHDTKVRNKGKGKRSLPSKLPTRKKVG